MFEFHQKILNFGKKQKTKFQQEIDPYLKEVPYWTAAASVGIFAFFYSAIFNRCIRIAKKIFDQNPHYLFVLSPLCFVLATWVVRRFAPSAGGTGVPQVTRALALDGKTSNLKLEALLGMRVIGVVAISSWLMVLGAGSLGSEGPMVHIGACIFYVVGKYFRKIWAYEEHGSWIIAGGAAGIAAAFNAPLAGVVFALEELSQLHFHRFKNVVLSAAIVAGIVAQGLSGRYFYFGYPKIGPVPLSSVLWALLVAIICGLCAYPFHQILKIDWQNKMQRIAKNRLYFAAIAGILVAFIANYVTSESIGGGISVIHNILFKNQQAQWSLIIGRLVSTAISHLSGAAGGFLAPSLALGAAIGSKFAVLISYPNPNLLVLTGMSAFLSAIIRAPFTASVIVMEMTDRHTAIFPIMIAAIVGYSVARRVVDKVRVGLGSSPQN